ncbi:homoserine dehydrogenase [Synchytrium microbalum]|uniref:Homoserine dehydrogenase n=1 Tax=Synchytrium microbalum TaxID=1806994 RepID=A0A507C6S7_9FUNG|nr:homoserine dehydrogenase [Synchytrium microbalum]TPX35048.1 homoserine dehydrogenase [Synchytrium microbalum]
MSINVGLIGSGLVGTALLEQLASHGSPKINIIAILSTSKLILHTPTPSTPGLDLSNWKKQLPKAKPADLHIFEEHLARNGPSCIVDCTASADIASKYVGWMKRNIHVVTPNKKAFSGDFKVWKEIRSIHVSGKALCFHEATVGAGLPILSTLYDMIATGDEVVKVEGIFSGTLSYIFNNFSSTSSASSSTFSQIVKGAKELGYTEPDPRDDLNGMDMARKVVILGRIAGLNLSLETLDVENIVPTELRSCPTADEFMSKLPGSDDHFRALNYLARAGGEVLRYVGVVDPKGASSVKLMRYPASHPFAGMKGSDNVIAITTQRFPNPLIIQGAGAGDAVTAFGVFSDLLKVWSSVAK